MLIGYFAIFWYALVFLFGVLTFFIANSAAAKIGEGILLDHGTGLVIGETAVVGNWVSLMQVQRITQFLLLLILNKALLFETILKSVHNLLSFLSCLTVSSFQYLCSLISKYYCSNN